ncbi:AI-2E family transporter [Noviherbaspirillum galbum]|uniref:AI-2E family transporter n=1 Tax=Noviherbaspirillum galbum TaxID=2709383 RepID=A0A6B3SVW8_9BURK|nr:AI-2E family transporter [Noviherbaspirillum galbum]NEX63046.1 AI-2E family transporter [Noviherbaspirillum galbum]
MQARQHGIAGTMFTMAVVIMAALVLRQFLLPLVWAGLICIATWPWFLKLRALLNGRTAAAALLMTLIVATLLALPAMIGLQQIIKEAPVVAQLIADANSQGVPAPDFLRHIPFAGNEIWQWWQTTLAQPRGLSHLFTDHPEMHVHSATELLRRFGSQILHRLLDFGFAMLCLFFFILNGETLQRQTERIGIRLLGDKRWNRYFPGLPLAVRSTVNGLVFVGLGEGVLIGIGYAFAGLPSAALWAGFTAMLAIIPFGAPVVFLGAAGILASQGRMVPAVEVAAWGMVVLFIADHFIRPQLIGSATRLPFLAVLFGILGGIELFGLVGLFLGPVIMVLAVTLWREASAPTPLLP